jgi:ATP-dependent exoDNAse (exonuclease V) alpha subunit
VGEVTAEDIEILQTRLMDPCSPNFESMNEEFNDCIWAFPTKSLADQHNKKKSRELKTKLAAEGKEIYTVNAQDTYADGYQRGQTCDPSLVPTNESKTGGIVGSLLMGEGSRFMLRRNKDVETGKVNGATGTILAFEWNYGREQPTIGSLPTRVKVQFDHMHNEEWLQPDNIEFDGKKNIRINRRMLSMILAWGLNHHKLQGITTDKIVIDVGKKTFAKGMAYVALSRVKTLAGLAISSLDLNKLLTSPDVVDQNGKIKRKGYTPCDTTALAELRRLREVFLQEE